MEKVQSAFLSKRKKSRVKKEEQLFHYSELQQYMTVLSKLKIHIQNKKAIFAFCNMHIKEK